MSVKTARPSPAFRQLVFRALARQANRTIAASIAFALCGAAYLAMTSTRDWFAWAMIGLGAIGAGLGLIGRARTPRLPRVRKLLEQAERVARVALAPSGHEGALRILFDDGDELSIALSPRDARLFATHLATFCPRAEIALPWLQRGA